VYVKENESRRVYTVHTTTRQLGNVPKRWCHLPKVGLGWKSTKRSLPAQLWLRKLNN